MNSRTTFFPLKATLLLEAQPQAEQSFVLREYDILPLDGLS